MAVCVRLRAGVCVYIRTNQRLGGCGMIVKAPPHGPLDVDVLNEQRRPQVEDEQGTQTVGCCPTLSSWIRERRTCSGVMMAGRGIAERPT